MRRSKIVAIIVCYSIVIASLFCFIGYKIADNRAGEPVPEMIGQTFYAAIVDTWGDSGFTVQGMEINDINYRGKFEFSVDEDTRIVWRGTNISMEDLDVGDNVSITFTGNVYEMNPVMIEQVRLIQLLDDEK